MTAALDNTHRTRSTALLVLALALLACTDDADLEDADETLPLTIEGLVLTQNPRNVLSFYADWQTSEPATTWLHYDCGPGETATLASETLTTSHRVFMMGLLESTTCQVNIASVTPDARFAKASDEFTTRDLSDATFPVATVTLNQPERVQPGWNLLNLVNHFDSLVMRVVLVDELGRYRWYYRIPWMNAGSDNDVRTVPEGVLIGAVGGMRPQIIAWDGSLIWESDLRMHHHIQLWPDNDHVLLMQAEWIECDEEHRGRRVALQNRETLEVVWQWTFCDVYDPVTDVQDWEHANAVEPFPEGDAFIFSARNQNALYRIDFETGQIDWAMGFSARPQDAYQGDFGLAEEDRFYQQHSPEIQANGNILLFDNGLAFFREESRAIEIAYDEQAMTAEVVWEYRHDPPLFSNIWGDADTLPNGNRLITFGIRRRAQGSVLVEATSDEAAEPVWVLEFPGKWGMYRTERVVEIPRGYVIEGED